MRPSLRVILAATLVLGLAVGSASAASIQDLVNLKAAGLSDDILIALIESDGSVFHLTATDIIAVRNRGLSERVIQAMLATARKPAPPPARPIVSPPVSEAPPGEAPPGATGARESIVQSIVGPETAPVVINVTQRVEQHVEQPRTDTRAARYIEYYPVHVPIFVRPAVPVKPAEPVYWGFGGQRRPDTWREKDK